MKPKKIKIAIAMSGGVDSSAAALLLSKDAYELSGCFMRLGNLDEEQAERAVRAVCRRLKIAFRTFNLADDFRRAVKDYYLESYRRGLTPNPCARCNFEIKFGVLLKRIRAMGADFLSTGHYVRLERPAGQPARLRKARDKKKDQSYFLYALGQNQLKRVMFPLGAYTKERARRIADRAGLPYSKRESQDACFLSSGSGARAHNEYLKEKLKLKAGPIKTLDGSALGEHKGLPLYTIGQRQGIEIGGTGPYYAAGMDHKKNILYVVNGFNDPALFRSRLVAREVNWISGREPKFPLRCEAVIRYRHKAVKCEVRTKKSEPRSQKITEYYVQFKEPQRAITPGQSVVFYKGDEVLGGGLIL